MISTAQSYILYTVQVQKLRGAMPPSSKKHFEVKRLAGGTYNRIMTVRNARLIGPKTLMLRVPRPLMADFWYIGREVAILRCVRHNISLQVANAISFDSRINTLSRVAMWYIVHC